jgi:hypothetical protein
LQEPANLPVIYGIRKVIGSTCCGKIVKDLRIHLIVTAYTSLLLGYTMAAIKSKPPDKDPIHP